MVGTSTSSVKSVKDNSAINSNACISSSAADAKRTLLAAAYDSNLTAFSSLSNIITQSQSNFSTNITSLK